MTSTRPFWLDHCSLDKLWLYQETAGAEAFPEDPILGEASPLPERTSRISTERTSSIVSQKL